jgi:peptide/nickel transport system substrate-binding protein
MKKIILWSTIMMIVVSMIATFSLAGCKEDTPAEEEVVEEAEEVKEEVKEEVEEEEATGPVELPSVTIGNSASISTLDGTLVSGRQSVSLFAHIYDFLYTMDREGNLQPDLALGHNMLDDLTCEMELRKGVKFHNGEEFTAEDVKFTIERILDPESKSTWRYFINLIERVEVVDTYTVRIITSAPFPGLINNVSLLPIISKAAFEEIGADEFSSNPMGTGPFAFEKWVKGEYVLLKANKEHWRGAPAFESVEFREIPDDIARLAALKSGEVDIIVNVSPDLIPDISKEPNLVVETVPSIRGMYVFIDTRCGPFKDVRVRQAINYLVDVEEIIDTLLHDTGATPINNMVPPMYFGHNEDLPMHPYPYNPEKAWELLKEAGYEKPFKITLNGPIGRYLMDKTVAQAIAGQLEREGFEVEYNGLEWGSYFKFMKTRKDTKDDEAVLFMLGYGAPHYDTATPWNEFLRIGSKIELWQDEEFTGLLDSGLSEMDENTRMSILNEGHQLIVERTPLVFLYQLGDVYARNDRIDWTPRSDELVWMWEATLKE